MQIICIIQAIKFGRAIFGAPKNVDKVGIVDNIVHTVNKLQLPFNVYAVQDDRNS